MITINVKASRRLYELADEARTEREHWKSDGHRAELAHISDQLEHAARLALSSSEAWCDAWCEAGVLTIRKYKGQRLLIEHAYAKDDELGRAALDEAFTRSPRPSHG